MMKQRTQKFLEKRLAFGMALLNGVNTLAPVGMLYTIPAQLAGGQQVQPLDRQPVATRISASQDRKPYSCADLQRLAYTAMSALDATAFGKAEAFTSEVYDGANVSNETITGGTQLIYDGCNAYNTSIGAGGTQIVDYVHISGMFASRRAWASNTIISAAGVEEFYNKGTQIVWTGGTTFATSIGTGGIQVVSDGGTASVTTINPGGTQILDSNGFAFSAIINSGGLQFVSSAAATYTTINSGGTQLINGCSVYVPVLNDGAVQEVQFDSSYNFAYIKSVASACVSVLNGGTQRVDEQQDWGLPPKVETKAIPVGSITTVNSGLQIAYSGGSAWIGTMNGGTQVGFGGRLEIANMYGGTQIISSGGAPHSDYNKGLIDTMYGGTQIVCGGGTLTTGRIDLMYGGTQIVSSGGTVFPIAAMSGGTQYILAGGTCIGGNYKSGGNVYSGGTVILGGTIYNNTFHSGSLLILSGTSYTLGPVLLKNPVDWLDYTSPTMEKYSSSGLMGGAFSNYGQIGTNGIVQIVFSGGTSLHQTIVSGGEQDVSSGGTVEFYDVSGVQKIYSGAKLDNGLIIGGTQILYDGAVTTVDSFVSGGTQAISGGTGKLTYLGNNGTQNIFSGRGEIATMVGGNQNISGGAGTVATMSGGTQSIAKGGTGTISSLQGGLQQVDGLAVATTVAGGTQILGSTGSLSKNVLAGGTQVIASGATLTADAAGTELVVQAAAIQSGTQVIKNGAMANGFSLESDKAVQIVEGTAMDTVINGGVQNVSNDGETEGTIINRGTQNVNNGGFAMVTMINSGGVQNVNAGGIVMNGIVNSGGIQNINSGGVSFLGFISGGTQNIASGGDSLIVSMKDGMLNVEEGGSVCFGTISSSSDTETEEPVDYSATSISGEHGTVDLGNISDKGTTKPGQQLTVDTLKGDTNIHINVDTITGKSDVVTIKDTTEGTQPSLGINYDARIDKTKGDFNWQGDIVVANTPLDVKLKTDTTEYGPVSLTPVISQDSSGNWHLTGYKLGASTTTRMTAATHKIIDQAWFDTVNSLSKRLGDLRLGQAEADNGIWARYQRSTTRAGRGSTSELNANLFQVGYDRDFKVKNGKTYVGIAVDHLTGGSVYEMGSGDARATSVALYNTWLGNKGHYYDIVLRQGHFINSYNITDLEKVKSEGDYSLNATTLSGEYGYRKNLKHGMYVEPQAEIIWGHMGGTDYTTKYRWSNWNVHMDATNHFLTRLGVAWGKSEPTGSYYAKASYYHDWGNANSLSYGSYQYSDTALRDWAELTLGGEVKAMKNLSLYGEVTKYLGDLTNNINFNVGARITF